MEVIDIDNDKSCRKTKKTPDGTEAIIITIEDSQRIKTENYQIDKNYWKPFGIEERNSYTITQLSPEADEEDDDGEEFFEDPPQEKTMYYYAFEKDCCCGVIKLSDDPPVYLNVESRFQLNISQMLEIVKKNCSLPKDLIRKPNCEIKRDHIPAELWNALWDPDGNSLKGSQLDTFDSCAVSMSKLFELYAGYKVKQLFSGCSDWNVFYEDGAAEILPTVSTEANYPFYIKSIKGNKDKLILDMIPDIVLEKNGKYIILDAKYKKYERPNRDDRLQILAYADVYDAHIIGHIFPQGKGKDRAFRHGQINTQHGKKNEEKYFYIQFALRDSNDNLEDLRENLQGIIKDAGLVDTNDTE